MPPPIDLACPSWLAVSASTQDLLAAAAQTWDDDAASEGYIRAVLTQLDVDLDALVGAYRYFFYKNNDPMALEDAIALCDRIQTANQWPHGWDSLTPLLLSQLDDLTVRLYLSETAGHTLRLHNLLTEPWTPDQLRPFFVDLPVAASSTPGSVYPLRLT